MKTVQRIDRAHLIVDGVVIDDGDETKKYKLNDIYLDINKRLWISGRVSRLGIFEYKFSNGYVSKELKTAEEVFNHMSTASLYGCPITVEHPMEKVVNGNNHKFLSVGTVLGHPHEEDGYYLKARLQIFGKDEVAQIKRLIESNETWELSCGYEAQIEEISGKWNGMEYNGIHRNIRYNHLSLVKKGRAGNEVALITEFPQDEETGVVY